MKRYSLRQESFASFEIKASLKSAVSFLGQGLLIFLLASVDKFGYSLALSLLCGLVFARQNVLVLAPCFIIAICVFSLEWISLAYACAPVVMLIALYMIFYKLRRNVPLWAVALCGVLSMTPYIVCECLFSARYLLVGIGALITVVFTFCCGISAYAIFVRGVLHKFTLDELICGGIVICVCAYALAGVRVYEFCAYDVVLAFCVLLCCACDKARISLFISLLFGIGSTLYSKDISTLAGAVVLGGAAAVFSPFTKWSSALAILAIEGILWLVDGYYGVGWQTIVTCGIGVICCLVLPKSFIAKLKGIAKDDARHSFSGIVNRRGRELSKRLYSASDVFYDMSKNLESLASEKSEYSAQKLAGEVAKSYCAKCSEHDICFQALGGDTKSVLLPMAEAALSRGKTTILDTPPFITSRCSNMHSLVGVINSSAECYLKRQSARDSMAICKSMMSQQFAGISLVLDGIASSCQEQVNFANDEVEIIKSELLKHNIVASEIVISGEKEGIGITALVRECDAQKSVLTKILSKCVKSKLELVSVQDRGDLKLVYLKSASIFEVAYGVATKSLENEAFGDSNSVLCPSRTRRLFAICDGMGHGERAQNASTNAIKMIESFYRAGIESSIILNLVNKLLKLCMDDVFSTLDIAVIDTQSGGLDVIKLGSCASFIIRRDNIEVLSCNSAPCGILDEVQTLSSRYQLYEGDMLLMMSDGVYDMLDNQGVANAIDAICTTNPQSLADGIMREAIRLGVKDDCTVLALRLFSRN